MTVRKRPRLIAPTFAGNVLVKVGELDWRVPSGSKVRANGAGYLFVLIRDDVHVLLSNGGKVREIELEPDTARYVAGMLKDEQPI